MVEGSRRHQPVGSCYVLNRNRVARGGDVHSLGWAGVHPRSIKLLDNGFASSGQALSELGHVGLFADTLELRRAFVSFLFQSRIRGSRCLRATGDHRLRRYYFT
jgi:hypothetical protein